MADVVDEYYRRCYSSVHAGAVAGAANDRLQKDLERPHAHRHFDDVLELGAGDLGHIDHVRHRFRRYVAGDLRPPPDLGEWVSLTPLEAVPEMPGRYFVELDAHDLPFPDRSFDRLVTTCLLMHLDDPMLALEEWRRVVRAGGVLDLLVPCDPGLAVRCYRLLVSRRRARSRGFEHFDLVNAIDHKRPVGSLLTVCRYAFAEDSMHIDWFPFRRVPSWNLNSHLVVRVRRAHSCDE